MISTVELPVEPVDPLDLRPPPAPERRCPREPFQHRGAVHRCPPLPVLKVDRAALTFAA